jgi:hypothetical protein
MASVGSVRWRNVSMRVFDRHEFVLLSFACCDVSTQDLVRIFFFSRICIAWARCNG